MKPAVVLFVVALVGSAAGWFLGSSHVTARSREKTDEAVSRRAELDQTLATDYALLTIPLVERGDTNAAVERLSRMIAVYYNNYAIQPGTNEWRLRGRRVIDEMASTNQILARMLKQVANGE